MSNSSTDPRVAFWSNKARWPDNTANYLFLGNVVQSVGEAVYGGEWSGLEPATEFVAPLAEPFLTNIPSMELQRCCLLLYDHDRAYRDRCPSYAQLISEWPMPSSEEWSRGVAISQWLSEQNQRSINRFIDVCGRLAHAFKNGRFTTALREVGGGPMNKQDVWFWNTEAYWPRFQTCRVKTTDPFDCVAAINGNAYIFVDRTSIHSEVAVEKSSHGQINLSSEQQLEYLSPYLQCMIAATRGLAITEADERKKCEITSELKKYWPRKDGPPTGEDLDRMATLMREPRHKRGRWKHK